MRVQREAVQQGHELVMQGDIAPVDVDQLRVVVWVGGHVPWRVLPAALIAAADLHQRTEGAELQPAREHVTVTELIIPACIGPPDREPHEGNARQRQDRAAQTEIGRKTEPEPIASGGVAPPEDAELLASGITGAEIMEEVGS